MFKLAIIGLDSSHSVVFTELIQGKSKITEKLRVVSCMRFPSAFQSEPDQDIRQEKLETLGVKVTHSFTEAFEEADGVMLEVNDPALHWEYFKPVAELGLPVFLDKPLADNLDNGRRIYALAQAKKLRVWSSSSLRFSPEVTGCAAQVSAPRFCNVFGPLGKAVTGSSLIWYGIHSFEMLMTLMGRGAQSVFARQDASGIVTIVNYAGERRGVVECNAGAFKYGGRAQNEELVVPYVTTGSPYPHLITALERFFIEGDIPVALEDSLEIQAILEAAEKSLESGKPENCFEK